MKTSFYIENRPLSIDNKGLVAIFNISNLAFSPLRTSWLSQCLRVFFLGIFALIFSSQAQAQGATYAYRSDVFAYDTPSASAIALTWHTSTASPACTSYPNGDDDWADLTFPGGFTFTFASTAYTSLRVYSNGILAFPPDVSGFHRDFTSQALPITAGGGNFSGCPNGVPTKLMVPYWLDIVAGTANGTTGAAVKYEILGTAPNRRLVISWVNVKLYSQTARYNFQVALYEGAAGVNGNFKYQYTTGSSTGAGAAVGVQVSTTDYTQYAYNQNFIDPAVGTAVLWYPANQLAAKSAEYRFDEGYWNGTAGEIKDISGNARHATRASSNVANVPAGKLCRGATFTNNTSNTVIDAVSTPLTPGNRGAVDFWYKSNVAWNASGSDAMLLDATLNAATPFFLLKLANGKLRFVLTDSGGARFTAETSNSYTYPAGTWHHVGMSWSLSPGTNQTLMQILLDGVQVTTNTSTPFRTTSSGSIAALGTVYVGDNRTSGVTPTTGSAKGANGTIDEVYFYDLDINATQAAADMALTRTNCTVFDHFHIIHNGEVVNCGGVVASVTVQAHDGNHALISLAGTSMSMSTSTGHGTWSSISTINPVSGSAGTGSGSYTFANESSVTFGLTNAYVESLNINLNSGGNTEHSGTAASCVGADFTYGSVCDADLNFAESGFQFDVPHHVAETAQTLTLRAVKKADNSSACTPEFANSTRNIKWTCTYANPLTGTLPVRVAGQALNAPNSVSSACDAVGRSINLTFDASGVGTTTVHYADVGSMSLTAQTLSSGITITGTDGFVAAPKDFLIDGYPAGPIRAGESFAADVTARNNAAAATPNFGKEAAAEGVVLTFSKYQPTGAGTSNGVFSTGSLGPFVSGVANVTAMNWSEVGMIDLIATLASGSYLGTGLTASGNTGVVGGVGRFIPHHFDTVVTQGCSSGGFTYSGQAFMVDVTARNLTGGVTQNYAGSTWAKNVTLSNAGASANMTGNVLPASDFALGEGTALGVTYKFPSPKTSPLTLVVQADDSDGVISSGFGQGSAGIRSGRLRLTNVFGSEKLSATMPVEAQYWSGSYFENNALDNCTALVVPAAQTLAAGVSPSGTAGLYFYPVVAGKNQLLSTDTVPTLTSPLLAGKSNLTFPAPQKNGWLDVILQAPDYLMGDWGNCSGQTGTAGLFDDLPCARVSFGVYGSKSPIIYRRENY